MTMGNVRLTRVRALPIMTPPSIPRTPTGVLCGLAIGQAKKLNPYDGNPDAIEAGRILYLQYGCSGCHGVGVGWAPRSSTTTGSSGATTRRWSSSFAGGRFEQGELVGSGARTG